jgi:hypothetical protein
MKEIEEPIPRKKVTIRDTAPIPLERPPAKDFKKGEVTTCKLRNDPSDSNSPGYDVHVRYFDTGTCEEFLKFEKDFSRVTVGQGIAPGAGQFELARRLFTGAALTTFDVAVGQSALTETTFRRSMNKVRESIFPKGAVAVQKAAMRQHMRKPIDMPVQAFVDRMSELNSYLKRFPPLAAGEQATSFTNSDFMDVLFNALPRSWQGEAKKQGFEPYENSVEDFKKYFKNFEDAEIIQGTANGKKLAAGKPSAKSDGKGKNKRTHGETKSNKKSTGKEFVDGIRMCPIHDFKHPMQDCKVLLNYKYKENASNKKFKKELNTTEMESVVKKAVKSNLKQVLKKAKAKGNSDLHAFEALSISSSSDEVSLPSRSGDSWSSVASFDTN